jgi:negative regulator of sigma E activity
MNEASRLLDGELTEAELGTLLERLKRDAAFRDEVSAQQLIRDSLAGLRTLDDGYTLRILARLRRARQGGT